MGFDCTLFRSWWSSALHCTWSGTHTPFSSPCRQTVRLNGCAVLHHFRPHHISSLSFSSSLHVAAPLELLPYLPPPRSTSSLGRATCRICDPPHHIAVPTHTTPWLQLLGFLVFTNGSLFDFRWLGGPSWWAHPWCIGAPWFSAFRCLQQLQSRAGSTMSNQPWSLTEVDLLRVIRPPCPVRSRRSVSPLMRPA